MTATSDERTGKGTATEEPVEEVRISEAAQQKAEEMEMEAATGAYEEAAAAVEPPLEIVPAPDQQVAELKDRLLRALADLENTRRRAEREVEETRKYAAGNFAKDLLSVSDNLRRAIDSIGDDLRQGNESAKNLVLGIEMVEKELLAAFERHGIARIEPLGQRFDHNFHQAMYEIPTADQPSGTIVQVLQPGYVMRDRLLRPAMVAVAKGGAPEVPHEDVGPVDTTA